MRDLSRSEEAKRAAWYAGPPPANPFDGMLAMIRAAVAEALTDAQLAAPAPYPVAVNVREAARLLSTSQSTIRGLVRSGTLRTISLDGSKRTLIPTVALFELDPAFRPTDLQTFPPHTDTDWLETA